MSYESLEKSALDKEEREQASNKRMKRTFEEENPSVGNPSDVLTLNVGGTDRIEVLRRTLTCVESSMLAAKFSGRWDDSLAKDKEGNFFIDHRAELFLPLISFLRTLAYVTPRAPFATSPIIDAKNMRDFKVILEYYGLTLAVFPFGIYEAGICRGNPLSAYPEYKVESAEEKSFVLCACPGNRHSPMKIQSFEVTLGRFSTAKVGWIREGREAGREGVGYVTFSIGVDCVRGGVAYGKYSRGANGDNVFIPSDELRSVDEGTVLRCEDAGAKWFVNGHRVRPTVNEDSNNSAELDHAISLGDAAVPMITIKGSLRVSNIELSLTDQSV